MTVSSQPLQRPRLLELLQGMRGRRIAIIGDLMLDRYLVGESDRLSPEAPVPVVEVRERRDAPGGAANVAANVVPLGGHAMLIGVVGEDPAAEALARTLEAHQISHRGLVSLPTRRTTVKTRVLAGGQQVVRIDEEDSTPLEAAVVQRLELLATDAIGEADVLVLEDYNKGVLSPPLIRRAIAVARSRGIPVVVDPKYHNFFEYTGATLFKPNRRELQDALGAGADLTDPATLRAAVARLGVEYLLLTLGSEGMLLAGLSDPIQPIPSRAQEVFDISGAGDTVTAWAAAALAAGASVWEAALIANLAAGIEVGKAGVATVSPAEVLSGLPRT